jgi:Flp pilus assembly protein TadG
MIILVPVLFMILYVVIEASKAYYLKEALSQGARQAARDMAIAYASNHNLEGNKSMQDDAVFSKVRIPNVINDPAYGDCDRSLYGWTVWVTPIPRS